MLERVQFDDWQTLITVTAFVLCFLAFLYFCWRAIRMSKESRKHMSNLPLQSEEPKELSSDERSQEK